MVVIGMVGSFARNVDKCRRDDFIFPEIVSLIFIAQRPFEKYQSYVYVVMNVLTFKSNCLGFILEKVGYIFYQCKSVVNNIREIFLK